MTDRRAGIYAGFVGLVLIGFLCFNRSPDAAARIGLDSHGLAATYEEELRAGGVSSPGQFARQFRPPSDRAGLSWDPTTARFFDRINVESVVKNVGTRQITLPGFRLTADELGKFKQNGFVVTERLGGASFGDLYYSIYNRDLPVFVTSDSILHAWHRSYDAMLEEMELTYLTTTLNSLLSAMHDAVPTAKAEYGSGVLERSLADADYYLAVARSLLNGRLVPTKLGQDARVTSTLEAVARLGIEPHKLFDEKLDREIDFSQFKPRGHYEKDENLRRYFRAMMWCGRIDFRIASEPDSKSRLSTIRQLGTAVVLGDLLRRSGQEETWRHFDRMIQTFVGRTDSATFDELAPVVTGAGFRSPGDIRTNENLDALMKAISESNVGKQNITSSGEWVDVLPRSFTFLGQKFAFDSWVTSKTILPGFQGALLERRVPSCLDVVFAALGNNHVVPEIVKRIESGPHPFRDQYPYQNNLAALRRTIDRANDENWNESIYTAWLNSLRALTAPTKDRLPEVMQTREWGLKQTNTQLASWTQLRHDTILYVKQSVTPGGICYYPAGFVEPVVPFWGRMESMARRAADLLDATPVPGHVEGTRVKQAKFLRAFANRMGQLKGIAEKEVRQSELSAEQTKLLEDVMQVVHHRGSAPMPPSYKGWYPALFYSGTEDCVKWDALVTDVHTDMPSWHLRGADPGCVLHEGVAGVDLLVIAIDNGRDRMAYVGPTLSHYEFEMPISQRKTDNEWKADIQAGKVPPRPEWTRGYLIPHPADAADHWSRFGNAKGK